MRSGFCLRHCRGTRDFVADDATTRLGSGHRPPARCPPPAGGSALMPRTCGRQNAPLVLFVTLSRLTRPSYPLRRNAAWLRALPAILFSQEKDAKVIQGVLPLDIPLMRLAAFPPVWAAIFPRFAGARPEGVPRSIRKNRRLPPKLPTLLAESKMRSRFHLRHCPRCPQLRCD